jgi:hypothetical protein
MTKRDVKILIDELRAGKSYPEVDEGSLYGLALPDFPFGKIVRKEAIVKFLNWQCGRFDGTIDEEELENCIQLFYMKKVIMS